MLLSKWNPLFAWIPIESLIHRRQGEYYKAISDSDRSADSTPFIIFMLQVIKSVPEDNVGINVGIKERILEYLKENPSASARSIALQIGYSQRQVERTISQLKKDGRITRIGSNKKGSWNISIEK